MSKENSIALDPSATSQATPLPELDDKTNIDIKITETESKLKRLREHPWRSAYITGIVVLFGVCFALFGQHILRDESINAPLYGLGFAAYGLISGIFASIYTQIQMANLPEELDALIAKKNILSKLSGLDETATDQLKTPYFDRLVDINVTNLGAYYGLIRTHTNNSFLVSIAAGGIGFGLIVTGLILGFINNTNAQTLSYIATGAGIITEFIAGIFFYLYNRTIRQMKEYHDSLLTVQNILLSFKIVGDTTDEKEKARMVENILIYLVGSRDSLKNLSTDRSEE